MSRFINEKSQIGQLILLGLQKKRKTMRQMSQETGISYSYITKLIDGNIKNPSFKYVAIISEYLDIPINDIIKVIVTGGGMCK